MAKPAITLTMPYGSFLTPTNLGEIPTSPSTEHQIDFRPISRYISEMVQDRDILAMEG